jgi:hypothetical protein
MSDNVDRASKIEEKQRQQALLMRKPELKAVGFCHLCGDWVEPGRIFCSVDCRDDWDREQAAKQRNGG